mmetsp:Transcript_24788/g.53697  ORF Transcript_24788/g.53697 Transcript_24788/m.53697 type:complete len:88 (+) Transcript_24788:282-545(+)
MHTYSAPLQHYLISHSHHILFPGRDSSFSPSFVDPSSAVDDVLPSLIFCLSVSAAANFFICCALSTSCPRIHIAMVKITLCPRNKSL